MAFGDIGDFISSTVGEVGKHPWQAAGAALGVPGFDPAIGGLFNNHEGGALLSPTGNFTSSAWNEMNADNPDKSGGLSLFHKTNSIADIVAPIMAGGFASGAFGGAGEAADAGGASGGSGGMLDGLMSNVQGLFGGAGSTGGVGGLQGWFSGAGSLGDSGATGTVSANGSGLSSVLGNGYNFGDTLGSTPTGLFSGLNPGASMGATQSGALGGGLSGSVAGASPIGGASMGGLSSGSIINALQQFKQAQQQQQQQNQQQRPQYAPVFNGGGGAQASAALQGIAERLNNLYGNQNGRTT